MNINVSSLIISDANPTIIVSSTGSQPGTMTGTFSSDTEFSAQNILSGTCTETYAIEGEFLDENSFEGTLTATFTGGIWCVDCTDHSWSVSGAK